MEKDLIIFGDSTSEICDYIFGKNEKYHPCWAAGWSARGLIKNYNNLKAVNDKLSSLTKDSNILLNFAYVDIEFNLVYKIEQECFYNIPQFFNEITEGVDLFYRYLVGLGFYNIFILIGHPILPLPPISNKGLRFKRPRLPLSIYPKLLNDYAKVFTKKYPLKVINCLPLFVDDNGLCNNNFLRLNRYDHHYDYVKAQDIVYSLLKYHIPSLPQRRKEKHNTLYHVDESSFPFSFLDLKTKGVLRPNTCR